MENMQTILHNSDFFDYREWLRLDLEGITWQGRFESDFEDFWSTFFVDGISLSQLMERFDFALLKSPNGPISAWFIWLRKKFLNYIFIYKNISLYQLSFEANMAPSELATILREFFIDKFPYLEEYFSNVFHIGNISSENLMITFSEIDKEMEIGNSFVGSHLDEIMPSMEVTLYEDWNQFIEKLKKGLFNKNFDFRKIHSDISIRKQLRFIEEIFVLLLVGAFLIWGVKIANNWYEKYLVNKISIYEPEFLWLDKSLKFKPRDNLVTAGLELNVKDIEEVNAAEVVDDVLREEDKFATESEVVLASLDTLPKDFSITELEQSGYEEEKKGGYRDSSFGNRKVFRIMIRSVNIEEARHKVNLLFKEYGGTQVDKVKPGTYVPGGVYYNLYIPNDKLQGFIASVGHVDESIIYENKARGGIPPGMNKVFIWIKSI